MARGEIWSTAYQRSDLWVARSLNCAILMARTLTGCGVSRPGAGSVGRLAADDGDASCRNAKRHLLRFRLSAEMLVATHDFRSQSFSAGKTRNPDAICEQLKCQWLCGLEKPEA